jgi:hypothetical protein
VDDRARRPVALAVLDHGTIRAADRAVSAQFYATFVLDPDGGNVESVFRGH